MVSVENLIVCILIAVTFIVIVWGVLNIACYIAEKKAKREEEENEKQLEKEDIKKWLDDHK